MANYLSLYSTEQMNSLFGALADPTRRNILERLTQSDLTISDIAKHYEFSLPTISKHLSVLERAQFVKKSKVGREYRVHFESQAMRTVADYASFYKKFWTIQIDNLEKFLAKK